MTEKDDFLREHVQVIVVPLPKPKKEGPREDFVACACTHDQYCGPGCGGHTE